MDFVFQRSYRGALKAIILDWAGTTMDYGCFAPAVVFMEVFQRKGVGITIEQAREPMGAHKKVHIGQIAANEEVARNWEKVHRRKPDGNDVDKMFRDFVPLQLHCLADYADLIPGALEAVQEFRRRGMKIGSTTGYTGEMMACFRRKPRSAAPCPTPRHALRKSRQAGRSLGCACRMP
jgi:phosphonoacetaldehyde hydrolase